VRRGVPLLVAAALVAACGGGDAGAEKPRATAAQDAGACARRGADVEVGGASLHLPRGGGDGPWPLVVALHGAGSNGAQARAFGFSTLGDHEGFATLYPTAQRKGFWALNRTYRPDDIPAVRALLERVLAEPCIDRARVFATGVSNGGGFAARMGCELSDVVRAIAPVAGGYRALEPCRPRRPVGVLEIHGTADTVVPYRGIPPERKGSVPRYLNGWAQRNGCGRSPQTTRPRRLVVRQTWRGCRAPVEHLRLARTGHGWPGVFIFRGGDPTGVDATREVWRFFSRVS
jgi:polyhydroxybutyrate depolymerase